MRFFKKLLTTPWGILLPLTGIVLTVTFYALDLSTKELARQLAAEVVTAPDTEVEKIVDKISGLGKHGVPTLVNLLHSQRRVVVFASRDALEKEFQIWSTQPQEQSAPNYLILARSLVKEVDTFSPTSKNVAISFVRRIMLNMLNSGEKNFQNQAEIASLCEELLDKTEPERIVQTKPQILDAMYKTTVGGEPYVTFSPDSDDVRTLVAANIERQRQDSVSGTKNIGGGNSNSTLNSTPEFFDPYSSARAEELYA
ncbi:MAG: hypothetical protein ACRC2T_15170, partial [Thermoguttaceae bacterium]